MRDRTFHGVALTVALAMAGCHAASPPPARAPELPSVAVETAVLSLATQAAREEVVGTVRARVRATLEAKVSGRIRSLLVSPGDLVKANQLIATLEVQEIQARLTQARAIFGQAESELARYETLLSQGAVTVQQVEGVRTRHAVAKATVSEAQTMLDYAEVRAPFAGVITHRLAEVGDLASPGRPLVELEDPRALRLEIQVPEGLIGIIEVGLQIPVQIGEPRDLIGTVAEIAPSANPNSRTFLVKLDLAPQPTLRPGQFGRAFIPSRSTEILRLPRRTILQRGQLELAFLVKDAHAHLRLVRTGKRFGDEVEVVSGLEPGETVVTNPPHDLVDGQPLVTR